MIKYSNISPEVSEHFRKAMYAYTTSLQSNINDLTKKKFQMVFKFYACLVPEAFIPGVVRLRRNHNAQSPFHLVIFPREFVTWSWATHL